MEKLEPNHHFHKTSRSFPILMASQKCYLNVKSSNSYCWVPKSNTNPKDINSAICRIMEIDKNVKRKEEESQTFKSGVWCFLTCRWIQELLSIGWMGTKTWGQRKMCIHQRTINGISPNTLNNLKVKEQQWNYKPITT